jgi:protein tyrosine/serine phosphatase/phosphoglycolate phosphatase-like HAD superfamily hydrolase
MKTVKFMTQWFLTLVLATGFTGTSALADLTATDPLPSWNAGPTKQAILDFVAEVTNPRSPNYVLPVERIVCSDNDGTLWPENPISVEMVFVLDELKRLSPSHPEWKNNAAIQAALKGDLDALKAGGKKSFEQAFIELVYATHANVTAAEFDARVRDWLKTARHPRFDKPYTELAYQPMLEVLELLRANDFKIFIVSGGGADFMRVFSEELYGIPPQQAIGSYGKAHYELSNGTPKIIKDPDVVLVNNAGNKAVAIHQFIGRKPIICMGNSDGDIEMLELTTIGRKPSLGLLVHHTDAKRAYAYNENPGSSGSLVKGLTEAPKRGWLLADMKNDWKTVFRYEGDLEIWSKAWGLSQLNTDDFKLETYLADLDWLIKDPKYKDPGFKVPKLVVEFWKVVSAMEAEVIQVLNQGPPYQPKFALDGAFIPYWLEKLYPPEWVAWMKALGMADAKITDDMVRAWQPQLEDVVALDDGTLISLQHFSHFDPGWTVLVPDYVGVLLAPDKKPPFATNPAQLKITDAETLSLALAGDWGTGTWNDGDNQLSPADAVMQQIDRLGVDYTIHLGDVYYTGTDPFIEHFAAQWMPGRRGAFTLNGNHEMYDWGKGYFEKALTHPTFSAHQGTSYFSIEFGDWLVVGLDVAYFDDSPILGDGALTDANQKAFLKDIRTRADREKMKVIVLTHHTGISRDGTKRTKLWSEIAAPDALGRAPDYWYWAHEHLGIVYSSSSAAGPDTVVRTVGHGGVPQGDAWKLEAQTGMGKPIAWYAHTPYGDGIPAHRRRVMNGFAVITLTRDGGLTEKFINQKGDVEWASPGRSLGIVSAPNLRDLGGYATRDGATVVGGLVYRSNQLNPIDAADMKRIAALGLKNDFDLRTAAERKARPDELPPGVNNVWLNVLADAKSAAPAELEKLMGNPKEANTALGGGKAEALFEETYREFVSLPSAKKSYRELFLALSESKQLPGLFHCTTGKDRTGWAAAALLTLLGVPRDTVMEDYLRSNDYILPLYKKQIGAFVAAGGEESIPLAILGVKAEYLDASFDEMERQYGSIENYFSEALGIDAKTQAKIRTLHLATE